MFTVGKVWCFLLRTGMDYKKVDTKNIYRG